MIKKTFFLILGWLLFSSCDELTGASTGADFVVNPEGSLLGGLTYQELQTNIYRLDGSSIKGIRSSSSFNLEFDLKDNQSISFYAYANQNLSGGVEFNFKRRNTELWLRLSLNGKSHGLKLLNNVSYPLNLVVDIHNDHTDAHILIWEEASSYAGHVGCSEDGSCLYNSEDFSFDYWLGVGTAQGTFWGMQGPKNSIVKLKGFLPPKTDV